MIDQTEYGAEDVIRAPPRELRPRYEESYEHGKREIRNARVKPPGRRWAEPGRTPDQFEHVEHAQTVRVQDGGESLSLDTQVPRVGLRDEPGPDRGRAAPSAGGHSRATGNEEAIDLPGSM